ncbi:TraB/GumN family protein [Rufibacter soli]
MKKILKRIALFVLLTPVVLLVLGFIAYGIYALLAVGGESTPHQAYLQKNKQEVRLTDQTSFPIFDSAFYQKQIFFLGEAHGCAMPQDLDFALLQHLNQRVGLKHYLAEVDYSQAWFLNEYLRTGEERHLQTVFQFWARNNAQWGNQNFFDKLKKIRALNQTLPAAQQISILGVDKIQDVQVTQQFLQQTLAQLPAVVQQDSAFIALRKAVSQDSLDRDSLVVMAQRILPTFMQEAASPTLSGPAQFDLQHTLENLAYLDGKTRRDSVMYLNLNTVVKARKLENAKLYGMWGLFHTIPVEVQRGVPFAYYLQQANSPFKGKTVSIGVYTIDSENMMPAAGMPAFLSKGQRFINTGMANNDGPMVFVHGIKDLRAVTQENSMTLFKTDAPDSPYRTSSRLATIKVLFPNQSIDFKGDQPRVSDVFQYVCLVRNSKALTPLPVL